MQSAKVASYTSGSPSRIERTTFDYNAAGIRVSALQEIDADANGTYELATRTEYLNDPANPTGYSQVLQETVTDPATGEIQKRVVYAVGLDQITQTTVTYVDGQPVSTETLVFNADGHGSTRLLTDLAGAILALTGLRQLFAYVPGERLLCSCPALRPRQDRRVRPPATRQVGPRLDHGGPGSEFRRRHAIPR